jgi:hypothetical protein
VNDILTILILESILAGLFGLLTLFVLFMEWQDRREEARKICSNCLGMTKYWMRAEKDKPFLVSGNCYLWEENSCSILCVQGHEKCHYNPSRFEFIKRPNIFRKIFDKLIVFVHRLSKEYKKLLGV